MRKFTEIEQEIIAALRISGRSVESLKEQYGVAEKQIINYVEKYKESDTFQVTDSNTSKIKWDQISLRSDLTESFIMENHKELLVYTDDIYETNKDFIKKQILIPLIHVNKNDSEFFKYELEPLEEVVWSRIETDGDRLSCYPNLDDFQKGYLIYRIPLNRLYIKADILRKKGFAMQTENDIKILKVSSPDKIYKGDKLLFFINEGDSYNIDSNLKKVIMTRANGIVTEKPYIGSIRNKYDRDKGKGGIYDHNERLVVKEGKPSLDHILKRNNLEVKAKRSETFNEWLKLNGYI